jgi:nucleoside 2-deoxyribosyltransferase
LNSSDIVVAVLDGVDVDSGTAWEIGYAYAKGKPVIGLRTDFRTLSDGVVNLMVEM